MVSAVVSLTKAFGMKTTAEGPENIETLELLREIGVDHAQRFIIGRPTVLRSLCESSLFGKYGSSSANGPHIWREIGRKRRPEPIVLS